MSGRISEYISVSKLSGPELMDVSVPDGGSPTGYVTRKVTIDQFNTDFPRFYAVDGDLESNRIVNQNSNSLAFNNGDFFLDSLNNGLVFDTLTRRTGLGVATPLAKMHVKGEAGDDLALFENSIGNDRFIINEDGQLGTGIGTNAFILADIGHFNQSNGKNTGFAFYGTNATSETMLVQMLAGTPKGIRVASQVNGTGTLKGVESTQVSNAGNINIGLEGNAREGLTDNYGVNGFVNSITNAQSGISTGVRGLNLPGLDYTGHGGYFISQQNSAITVYTSIDMIGSESSATGSTNGGTTGLRSIGSIHKAVNGNKNIALLIPNTNNDGIMVIGADDINATGTSIVQITGDHELIGTGDGYILKSPDATRWKIQVDNAGALSAVLA